MFRVHDAEGGVRVQITWEPKDHQYRVSRVKDDGSEVMYAFFASFSDAIAKARYFESFGDVA